MFTDERTMPEADFGAVDLPDEQKIRKMVRQEMATIFNSTQSVIYKVSYNIAIFFIQNYFMGNII